MNDFATLACSILTILLPMAIVFIARAGKMRLIKHEGKCFLAAVLFCAYYGFKRSPLFFGALGTDMIWSLLITHLVLGIILGFACMVAAILLNKLIKAGAQEKKNAQLANSLNRGDWEFPCQEFYALCEETKISVSDNSEFGRMKLQKAVQYILEKHGVPEAHWDKFLHNGAEYYQKAIEEQNRKAEEAAEAKQKHDTTLVSYKPSKDEKQLLDGINRLRCLHGLDKRRAMLKNELSALEQKRTRLRAALKDESQPVSVNFQKEKSWAAWGGVADAIAGPAAGVMTALQVQEQNAKTREQNRAMLEAASYLNAERRKRQEKLEAQLTSLCGSIRNLEDELDKLSLKIILPNPGSAEIQNCLKLKNAEFTKTESGILNITATAHCVIPKENLPDSDFVADGTVHAKVYLEDTFVEDVYFVLPRGGISVRGNGSTVHSLCTTALPVEGNYQLKLSDNSNLWIMEK